MANKQAAIRKQPTVARRRCWARPTRGMAAGALLLLAAAASSSCASAACSSYRFTRGLLRSAAGMMDGLPRARRPETVERRRRGALGCPLRVPVPQRMTFSGSALATKPAPSRDRRVRRLRAGVVRAMRAIRGWPGTFLLVSYGPLAFAF